MPDQADELRRLVERQRDTAHHVAAFMVSGERIHVDSEDTTATIQAKVDAVMARKGQKMLGTVTTEPPETAEAYRAKLDRVRHMVPRGKSPLQSIAAELAKVERLPTLGFLWTTLESDLERWVRVGGFDKPNLSTEELAEFWEMMQRREEQV